MNRQGQGLDRGKHALRHGHPLLRGFTARTADEEPEWRKKGNELLTGYQKNW
jgi:hypothetical protein